jgi:hypothetical protein
MVTTNDPLVIDEMRALYEVWVRALRDRDRDGLARLFDESYFYTSPHGIRLSREDILDLEMDVPLPELPFLTFTVQDLGELRITRGSHGLIGAVSAEVLGSDMAERVAAGVTIAFTTVWRRRGRSWVAVSNDAHLLAPE